jgi:hypothetical protein
VIGKSMKAPTPLLGVSWYISRFTCTCRAGGAVGGCRWRTQAHAAAGRFNYCAHTHGCGAPRACADSAQGCGCWPHMHEVSPFSGNEHPQVCALKCMPGAQQASGLVMDAGQRNDDKQEWRPDASGTPISAPRALLPSSSSVAHAACPALHACRSQGRSLLATFRVLSPPTCQPADWQS